ncbi:MAG: 50S ribosomal protein L11 methyltransferase [Chlamydiales bacterium]
MVKLFCLEISPGIPMEEAWSDLEEAGFTIAYSEEESNRVKLFAYADSSNRFDEYSWVENCSQYQLPEIDWKEQWQMHGMDFRDGCVHVDLNRFGASGTPLKLQPGPGFGDLSHPTTALALRLMVRHLHGQSVIDIGSGSGILTLAAIALGSPCAYGLDIDAAAIEHARKNAQLNGMAEKCCFIEPGQFKLEPSPDNWLIVMNMIMSEQRTAWDSLPALHAVSGLIITSGITKAERESYLEQTHAWGWQLLEEMEDNGWMALIHNLYTSGQSEPNPLPMKF